MNFLMIPILILPLVCCSCRVIPPDPPRDPEEESRRISAGTALGNEMLGAIRGNSFQLFSKCLKNGPAAQMTLQDFRTSRENMRELFGTLKTFEFLTALRTPAVENLIWKVTFIKTGKDGREITSQVLFRLVTGTDEGKSVVLSFGFL